MKPSWDDAPPWAKWLAMDSSGVWHWFSEQPVLWTRGWAKNEHGDLPGFQSQAGFSYAGRDDWSITEEPRP